MKRGYYKVNMNDERLDEDGSLIVACTSLLRGLYREVFGCFVPGAITVCFFISLPMLTYYVLTPAVHFNHTVDMLRELLNGSGRALGYVIGTLFVTFSYAIGSILYRRPLENADAVASLRKWANTSPKERGGLTVQFNKLAERSGSRIKRKRELLLLYADSLKHNTKKCWIQRRWLELKMNWPLGRSRGHVILDYCGEPIKYPYPCLWHYLEERGLEGLQKFVGWRGGQPTGEDTRSKLCSKNAINEISGSSLWNERYGCRNGS